MMFKRDSDLYVCLQLYLSLPVVAAALQNNSSMKGPISISADVIDTSYKEIVIEAYKKGRDSTKNLVTDLSSKIINKNSNERVTICS